jgi:hypothetical protein
MALERVTLAIKVRRRCANLREGREGFGQFGCSSPPQLGPAGQSVELVLLTKRIS